MLVDIIWGFTTSHVCSIFCIFFLKHHNKFSCNFCVWNVQQPIKFLPINLIVVCRAINIAQVCVCAISFDIEITSDTNLKLILILLSGKRYDRILSSLLTTNIKQWNLAENQRKNFSFLLLKILSWHKKKDKWTIKIRLITPVPSSRINASMYKLRFVQKSLN